MSRWVTLIRNSYVLTSLVILQKFIVKGIYPWNPFHYCRFLSIDVSESPSSCLHVFCDLPWSSFSELCFGILYSSSLQVTIKVAAYYRIQLKKERSTREDGLVGFPSLRDYILSQIDHRVLSAQRFVGRDDFFFCNEWKSQKHRAGVDDELETWLGATF